VLVYLVSEGNYFTIFGQVDQLKLNPNLHTVNNNHGELINVNLRRYESLGVFRLVCVMLVTSVSKHPVTVNVQAARSCIRLHLVAPSDNTKWITEAMRAT